MQASADYINNYHYLISKNTESVLTAILLAELSHRYDRIHLFFVTTVYLKHYCLKHMSPFPPTTHQRRFCHSS